MSQRHCLSGSLKTRSSDEVTLLEMGWDGMGWGDMDTDPEGAPRVDVPAGQQRGGVRVPRAEAQRARRQGHARRRRLARRVRLARAAPQRALVVAAVRPHLQQLHLILLPYHIRSHLIGTGWRDGVASC